MDEISDQRPYCYFISVLFLLHQRVRWQLLCERVKVSPVIGEIFAGVMVGHAIFPVRSTPRVSDLQPVPSATVELGIISFCLRRRAWRAPFRTKEGRQGSTMHVAGAEV